VQAAKPATTTPTRNERHGTQIVETFEFNENSAAFGSGDATIVDVKMLAADGSPLAALHGGEQVQVVVDIRVDRPIESPIVGFYVKDRLGQPLFGDNSFAEYQHAALAVGAGERMQARFKFMLPLLRTGDYAITAAIASGTLEAHVQHHWLHDAVIFTVHSPYRNGVMIALPMLSIELDHVAGHVQPADPDRSSEGGRPTMTGPS
jgi:lipopolysaccharide transport system ATP-binding protein